MNYKTIFHSTLRLLASSKLLWVLGALAIVSEVIYRVSIYSIGKHPVSCIPYPLVVVAIYFSSIAICGLIYSTHWIVSEEHPIFAEAWHFSKTKVRRVFWLYFLSIPLVMFSTFLPALVNWSEISALLAWFVYILATFFLNSLLILSICTIVINNLDSGLALWTGLQIMFNNFLHVIVLSGIYLILQILIMGVLENTFFGIVVVVPFTVTMTLAYRVFIAKDSYPALSNIQSTA
jgi:hypothetical protein